MNQAQDQEFIVLQFRSGLTPKQITLTGNHYLLPHQITKNLIFKQPLLPVDR